jgi:sugar phosphate isomerase/epimerase
MKRFGSIVITLLLIGANSLNAADSLFFKISLAEWSLHRALQNGEITNLDFPKIAKQNYDIDAVEYVNLFFKDKAEDTVYLSQLKNECTKYGVKSLLIMIDGEGNLADTNAVSREQAIKNHYKWIKAAQFLGCHSIRVNAAGNGTADEVKKAAIDGISKLCNYAAQYNINVIIENHWGYSSNGQWLTDIIKQVNKSNCGTLPDFGNFDTYDRYKGVEEMMPFAKGVSGKSYNFDTNGNETKIDFFKMLSIVKKAGYTGYIDVEYEGDRLSEDEGIKATKALLIKAAKQK